MTVAAIYSRFSTDKQSESSIEDQVRVCRQHAKRLGFDVAEVFSDAAVSGSSRVADRPGGRRLLEAALALRFDVLLLEGLDRLSRDQPETEVIVRRLEHRGIRVIASQTEPIRHQEALESSCAGFAGQ